MGWENLLQPAAGSPFVLLAAALGLGALHALEPGHSKTVMAAFVVAVRGTAWQAALLALSVAVSHTLIVWILAWVGWRWGISLVTAESRPYLVTAAGTIVLLVGVWSGTRSWQALRACRAADPTDDHPHHDHLPGHPHRHPHGHDHPHDHDHNHNVHPPHHHRLQGDVRGDPEEAHQRAHAADLCRRFRDGRASNRQIVLFGMTGGLIPCSAAIAVLLVCLQQRDVLLGIGLVGAFTLGLTLTLMLIGILAASGTAGLAKVRPLQGVMRYAACVSGIVLAGVGVATVDSGLAMFGL